jgi:hypothetical protein
MPLVGEGLIKISLHVFLAQASGHKDGEFNNILIKKESAIFQC